MSDKPLKFHTDALAELKSAISWYLERNEIAAYKFVDEIDNGIESIRSAPKRWPILELNARKFLLKRFPFAIIYRERPTEIQVIAVGHGHRRPGYWRARR
jgi:plasmid stabilization system protein ParE